MVDQPVSQDLGPVFNLQQTPFDLSDLGVFDEDPTDNSAETQDPLPVPDLDDEPIEGEAKFKGVLSEFPSHLRSFNDEAAHCFGFATKADFIAKVNESCIRRHIEEFDAVRRKFDSLYKSAVGVNTRPTLASLEQQISVVHRVNPERFELTARNLMDAPFNNELDNYAIMLMQFKNAWFTAQGAPLGKQGIPPTLHLDRVHALVKLVDKLPTGYQPINKSRVAAAVQHEPKASRVAELKVQTSQSKHRPIGTPAERREDDSRRRHVTVNLNRLLSQAKETTRLQEESQRVEQANKPSVPIDPDGDLEEITADTALHQLPLDDPHAARQVTIDDLAVREALRDQNAAKKAEELKKKKRDRKRAKSGKPESLVVVKNDAQMGYDTTDPKKAKRLINNYTVAAWTEDPDNPIARSFCEGWVVGVPRDSIAALQAFTETDWLCADEEKEMSFDTGPTTVVAANRETTGVIAQLAALNTTDAAAAAQAPSGSGEPSTSADNESSENDPLSVIGDETDMSPQERQARAKARSDYRKDLKARSDRLTWLRKAAGYQANSVTEGCVEDKSPDFVRKLFHEQRYTGLHDTNMPSKFNDAHETDDGRETNVGPSTNINDPALRMSVDEACSLMDNSAYQPKGYKKYLNLTMTPRRKSPRVVGQAPESYANMWWQTNGAGNLYERRTRAMQKRLYNLEKSQKNGDSGSEMEDKSLQGVEMGAILADEVGIGKTNTVCLYRKVVSLWPQ